MPRFLNRLLEQQKVLSLLAQLDDDRKALLAGRLDALALRGPQLEALASQIEAISNQADPSLVPLLERVIEKAERNARLIQAARDGLTAARKKLETLADGSANLNTYTDAGNRVTAAQRTGNNDKRV